MGFDAFDGTTKVVLPGGATLVAQISFVEFRLNLDIIQLIKTIKRFLNANSDKFSR